MHPSLISFDAGTAPTAPDYTPLGAAQDDESDTAAEIVRTAPRPGPLFLTMRSFYYSRDVDTADEHDDERSAVVHLVPYVFPVRRLVDWYDSLADINRDEPDIYELDEIVVALQALPRLPGQLGRDLALIADATDDTFRSDIIDAIGRLRRLGTLEILDDPNPDFLLDDGSA